MPLYKRRILLTISALIALFVMQSIISVALIGPEYCCVKDTPTLLTFGDGVGIYLIGACMALTVTCFLSMIPDTESWLFVVVDWLVAVCAASFAGWLPFIAEKYPKHPGIVFLIADVLMVIALGCYWRFCHPKSHSLDEVREVATSS